VFEGVRPCLPWWGLVWGLVLGLQEGALQWAGEDYIDMDKETDK
jgi:hypothetical protein